ncbi:MAG TPA: hypothetical protein VFA68_01290 [Terriglobales bacterium]|nr:hypothetical protein [Terriglobales bacterium]
MRPKSETRTYLRWLDCDDPNCESSRKFWRRLDWRRSGVNLNGRYYCATRCFERAAELSISRAMPGQALRQRAAHRIPLGLVLLSRGQISHAELRQAIARQRAQPSMLIGALLTEMGYVDEDQVTAALARQWCCPTLAGALKIDPGCRGLLPARISERFRVLPVRYVRRTGALCVAFAEGVNYPLLYTIDSMLDCHTEPCLIAKREMDRLLETGSDDGGRDVFFDHRNSTGEAAHILASYVMKVGAHRVRLGGCEDFIWARLEHQRDITNLLFHCSDSALQERAERSRSRAPSADVKIPVCR